MKVVIIGGGAGGFFAALAAKKLNPSAEVLILEKSAKLLSKVRISGGGRCNVTHGCFDPKILVKNYPRGAKELLGPFHRFQPLDTIKWFESRGVILKQEADNRIFPVSNSSETIINCFLKEADKIGVEICTRAKVSNIRKVRGNFELEISGNELIIADRIILATGSSQEGLKFAKELGHSIQHPVASLFTFNIPKFTLSDLAGISINEIKLKIADTKFESNGSMLITHWGFSGPAALRLSALGARFLAEKNYLATLIIDWVPDLSEDKLCELMEIKCRSQPKKQLVSLHILPIPKNLWKVLCERFKLSSGTLLNTLNKKAIAVFCRNLKKDSFSICGKTTNKEEFVTCGGVSLSEVNFKTMESKLCSGLFFCGEVLDIDGVTGGFNFQNAWTTGWIAGTSVIDLAGI